MVRITLTRLFHCKKNELFDIISDIQRLSHIKKDIKEYQVIRDEPGLQIVDVDYNLSLMKVSTRLLYQTRPDMFAELKQIKGDFEKYHCRYNISDSDAGSLLGIDLTMKLPYGPLGFMISKMIKINLNMHLKRELKLIERLVKNNIAT